MTALRSPLWPVYLVVQLALAGPLCAEPVFVARTTSGKEYRGPLAKLAEDWLVELGKGVRKRIPGDELLELSQQGMKLPPLPTDEHLILANGDRVPVRNLRLADEKLHFLHKDLGSGKEVSLPLSNVALIWRVAPDRIVFPEQLRHRLLRGSRPRDVVLLRNGDTIEGTLNRLGSGKVEIEVKRKMVTADWALVAAIALSTELADKMQPKGPHARIVLAATNDSPGGRFTLTAAEKDGEDLRGKTVFGASLRVPIDRVVTFCVLGDRVSYLSDLKAGKYVYFPYLDEHWPWSADATVMGRDLVVGGASYDRGVGMHGHSRLVYALEGKYRRFEAVVGLDDRDGKKGQVRLRVLVDGKEVELEGKGLRSHADGPLSIAIDVTGAKELTLEVAHGKRGPVQAVVNWANARLIR